MQKSHDQACHRRSRARSGAAHRARAASGLCRRGAGTRQSRRGGAGRRDDGRGQDGGGIMNKFQLDVFEGPLDLLLHLIKKNEVSITDIPIAVITEQYLAMLELMQGLDLDVAGEFLVMAATLVHIKSRMLLPPDETDAGEEDEGGDPRDELVRRLLEYQRFKEAAGDL